MHPQQLRQEIIRRFRLVFLQHALWLGLLTFSDLLLREDAQISGSAIGEERKTPRQEGVPFVVNTNFGQVTEIVVESRDHTVVGASIEEAESFAQLKISVLATLLKASKGRLTVIRAMVSNATSYLLAVVGSLRMHVCAETLPRHNSIAT